MEKETIQLILGVVYGTSFALCLPGFFYGWNGRACESMGESEYLMSKVFLSVMPVFNIALAVCVFMDCVNTIKRWRNGNGNT